MNAGCEKCLFRGYSGRKAIFDIFVRKSLFSIADEANSVNIHDKFCLFTNFHDEESRAFLMEKLFMKIQRIFCRIF